MMQRTEGTATLPAPADASRAPAPRPAKSRLRTLAQMLAGAGVGGAMAIAGMALFSGQIVPALKSLERDLGGWTLPVLLAAVAAATFVAIAVHELGHVLGGLAARFRFWFYVVGPLRVERDEATERLTVGLNRLGNLSGGVAALLPTDTRDLPRRFALMVAGGPLASLALAVLAWVPLGMGAALAPGLYFALLLTMLMSAALFVVTLVPMRAGGFASDGARLLLMARGGPRAEREAATLPLIAMLANETPPREWPAELVDAALALRDGSSDECFAQTMAYYRALDLGRTDEAGRMLDRAMELLAAIPPGMAPAMHLEAAYFEAAHRRDAARSREHLAKVPEKAFAIKPYDRDRAEAALALAEGDRTRARELAERSLAGLPAKARFRRDSVAALLAAAEASSAAEA